MSEYLIRYQEGCDEIVDDEAHALARIVELFELGETASLWLRLPVKLTAKAKIIKRKSPAPAQGAEPPTASASGAGESRPSTDKLRERAKAWDGGCTRRRRTRPMRVCGRRSFNSWWTASPVTTVRIGTPNRQANRRGHDGLPQRPRCPDQ